MQILVLGQPLVPLSNCSSLLNLLVKSPETLFKSPNLKRHRRPGILTKALAGMFSLVAVLGLFACPAFAQNTSSSISGTVVDASGAVIPNASISVHNNATGQTLSATSDARGAYTITNIQPGSYTVTATATGFQPLTQNNAVVDANIGRQLDFTLKAGNNTTTVTVQADANALQTESAVVGQLVTTEQVKSIALNGRNPIYLSQLEPGVTRNAPLTSFNFTPDFGGPQISGA